MSSVSRVFEEFENRSCDYQINLMESKLKDADFEPVSRKTRHGREMIFYLGEDTVFAIAPSTGEDERGYTVMDRWVYDEYFAKKEKFSSFSFSGHDAGDNDRVIVYKMVDPCQDKFSKQVMKATKEYVDGLQVDHIYNNPRINTREALRLATGKQNSGNKRKTINIEKCRTDADLERQFNKNKEKYGECAYNVRTDFSETWFAYVLFKMIKGFCTWKDLEDYNYDYNFTRKLGVA